MTESIMSSVEGQCELEIKPAVSLDLFDQNNQSKTRTYFVSVTDFFILIKEKSKVIGQLFIPSYTGYEQFQDNVRFNFFFRVRDSVGFDLKLMPPERLRKRFESKLHSIGKMIANMAQKSQDDGKISNKFECNITIKDKSVEKVTVHIKEKFINIFRAENHIFLDKIDLSEPNVYVDGFIGFEHPPNNPTVFIYADNQLRQTLTFDKKQLNDSQEFMKTVARGCARYCDKTHNPLMKGLEIKNSESRITNKEEQSSIITLKRSDSIGINEFREEPKYTKFPQTMKQKMKKDIKSQIKMHKNLFEQSKKELRDLRANQKRIQSQQEQIQSVQEKQLQKQEQENKQSLDNDDTEQNQPKETESLSKSFYTTVQNEPDSDSESDDLSNLPQAALSHSNYPQRPHPLQLSNLAKNKSQIFKAPSSINISNYQNQSRHIEQSPSNDNWNRMNMEKSKSQPNVLQNNNNNNKIKATSTQSPKKEQIPLPKKSPIKDQQQGKVQSFQFFPYRGLNLSSKDEESIKTKEEDMNLEDKDIENLQIIIKSYLMIDYRNEYFTENDLKNLINTNNQNENNDQSALSKLLNVQSPKKGTHETRNISDNQLDSSDLIIEELKEDLRNQAFLHLVNIMMKENKEANDLIDLIESALSKEKDPESQKEGNEPSPIKKENKELADLFKKYHDNDKLCEVFNQICILTNDEEFLQKYSNTYFSDLDVLRELSNEEWNLIMDKIKKMEKNTNIKDDSIQSSINAKSDDDNNNDDDYGDSLFISSTNGNDDPIDQNSSDTGSYSD